MTGSSVRLGAPFWLALACSGLVFALWVVDARHDSLAIRELESRKEDLELDILKCSNLAKVSEQLDQEILNLRNQLVLLERIAPPSQAVAEDLLERSFKRGGLRVTQVQALQRRDTPGRLHDLLDMRVSLAPARASWWEPLGQMQDWPLTMVARRLEVADPRNPEADMDLDITLMIGRHSTEQATDD